jgi:hypothetical protein
MEQICSRPEPSAGCSWEEKLQGAYSVVRCGNPVAPGKPWCLMHLARFQRGNPWLAEVRW